MDLDPTMKELLIRDLFAGEYSEVLKYVPEEVLGADIVCKIAKNLKLCFN